MTRKIGLYSVASAVVALVFVTADDAQAFGRRGGGSCGSHGGYSSHGGNGSWGGGGSFGGRFSRRGGSHGSWGSNGGHGSRGGHNSHSNGCNQCEVEESCDSCGGGSHHEGEVIYENGKHHDAEYREDREMRDGDREMRDGDNREANYRGQESRNEARSEANASVPAPEGQQEAQNEASSNSDANNSQQGEQQESPRDENQEGKTTQGDAGT